MDEEYDSLTESEFEEIIEKEKITLEEVQEWASKVRFLKISGGLKKRGWTQHDIDFWFDLPRNRPWSCPCRELIKKLPEPKFGLPVSGRCAGCGAVIAWNNRDKRWDWYWDHTKYEYSKGEYQEGITQKDIEEMRDRIDKLEGR